MRLYVSVCLDGMIRFAFLTGLMVIAGCSADNGTGASFTTRDSAGVTIVESASGVWASPESGWRVSEQPEVVIGVAEGNPEYELSRIVDALRLDDGRLVVVNGRHELRFYDAGGKYLRVVGREGAGPGEFRSISWIDKYGDSLVVSDWLNLRLSFFSSNGDYSSSVTLRSTGLPGRPDVFGITEDGSVLARVMGPRAQPSGGLDRDVRFLYRIDLDGQFVDSIGSYLYMEWVAEVNEGGGMNILVPYFRRNTEVLAAGNQYIVADNSRYELRFFDPNGSLRRIVRRSLELRALTDAHYEVIKAVWAESAPSEAALETAWAPMASLPRPETMPAFGAWNDDSGMSGAVLYDDAGNAWVRQYFALGDEKNLWEVFDPSGKLLGPVELPFGFAPLHIDTDFMVGRWLDEFDVQYLHGYSIQK